jgi:hypothetical protein
MAMADAMKQGDVGLRSALHWQFRSNFFPPLDVAYVDIVAEVIENLNSGEMYLDSAVRLPTSLVIIPSKAMHDEEDRTYLIKAGDLIEITRTWDFVDEEII